MKKYLFLITALLGLVALFSSCEKGELIEKKSFGKLKISSSFQPGSADLLVKLDNQVIDTLTATNSSRIGIILEAGEKKYELIKKADGKVLLTTQLLIVAGKTTDAPPFLYDGTTALFDDLDAKPVRDSMLVRFINQEASFPDLVNLEFRLLPTGKPAIVVKKLNGVPKNTFSEFVQLPDPLMIVPGQSLKYQVVGFNAATQAQALGPISMDFATSNGSKGYIPNLVTSYGIKKRVLPFLPDQIPVIFQRTAQ